MFDFDASTAKFKIYQNKLMPTAPILPKKSIVNPNCSCLGKNDISSEDVINSAEKISATADNLMVDKLCVNEMKNIYNNSSKRGKGCPYIENTMSTLYYVLSDSAAKKWKTPALNEH